MQEMQKTEADMFILGLINSCKHKPTDVDGSGKRRRQKFNYSFNGESVCVSAFRTVYDVGTKHLDNLKEHLDKHGACPRVHGNTGRTPSHAINYEDVKCCVAFLNSHAQKFGIPHPAPLHGGDDRPPIFLPAYQTRKSIHEVYRKSCVDAQVRAVSERSLRRIWSRLMPNIKIMTPRTNVCTVCEKLRRNVTSAVQEDKKLQVCQDLTDHITDTQKERDFYRQKTIDATEELRKGDVPVKFAHYAFDFAQNVCIPNSARQEGPLYFKTLHRVQVFDIC